MLFLISEILFHYTRNINGGNVIIFSSLTGVTVWWGNNRGRNLSMGVAMVVLMLVGVFMGVVSGAVGNTAGIGRGSVGESLCIQNVAENLVIGRRLGIGHGQSYQTDQDGKL
jgi:hypothetical protein